MALARLVLNPAPVPYANLTNPQTLNLYAMVQDNPESFADLDGHGGNQNGNSGQSGKDKCNMATGDACDEFELRFLDAAITGQPMTPDDMYQALVALIAAQNDPQSKDDPPKQPTAQQQNSSTTTVTVNNRQANIP